MAVAGTEERGRTGAASRATAAGNLLVDSNRDGRGGGGDDGRSASTRERRGIGWVESMRGTFRRIFPTDHR
jgi:hypothetical protein